MKGSCVGRELTATWWWQGGEIKGGDTRGEGILCGCTMTKRLTQLGTSVRGKSGIKGTVFKTWDCSLLIACSCLH